MEAAWGQSGGAALLVYRMETKGVEYIVEAVSDPLGGVVRELWEDL